MRILVLGATGYIGSRLTPVLLARGHEVVAGTSRAPDPQRFEWGTRVEWRTTDILDSGGAQKAIRDVDAVVYLVHALDSTNFAELDRLAATHVRDAVAASDVRRLVYLSGLVPDGAREQLSEHLASRLEVEEILQDADCSALTLRAGVVIGAGSTSFEVIRQMVELLLVQPVPLWLRTRIQPVAVSDVLRALAEGIESQDHEGAWDLVGPDVLRYPQLLDEAARAGGLRRLRVPAVLAPLAVVAPGAASLVRAPFHTVRALIESLRHDMVARPDRQWVHADGHPFIGVRQALQRAWDLYTTSPEATKTSDPAWTRPWPRGPGHLRLPATTTAGIQLGRHRLAQLLAGGNPGER